MIMKLIKGQRVLTFILAVIISTVIMNLVYPMLFGNRDLVLSLASTQTTASRIPDGQSEIKKLQPLVAVKDMESFMSIKEVQYDERRKRILSYCSKENNTLSRKVLSNHMMFNKDAGVSMCYIPKVASSTWIAHFANIQDVTERKKSDQKGKIEKAPRSVDKLINVWNSKENLSMVVVRHPLSRLVSAYYNRFVSFREKKNWKKMIKHLIGEYRQTAEGGPRDYPTPSEYIRFILDSLKKEYYKGTKYPATFDHWRPQHKLCPFCLINFRIYSRLEENDEDALYFFTKAGLGSDFEFVRENVQGERGKAANVDMTHERFWSQVEPELVSELNQPWSYKHDFKMMGYSPEQYFAALDFSKLSPISQK